MKKVYIAIYGFCLGLFGLLGYFAHQYSNFPGDIAISLWLQRINLPFFNPVMQAISFIASLVPAIIMVSLVSVGLLLAGKKVETIFVVSLTSVSTIIDRLLKLLINRPRPENGLVLVLGSNSESSFPSGHMCYAVVFYGFLFYLAPRLSKRQSGVIALRSVLILLIILTGVSRIYLGAHWFSDVYGSLLLGGLLLVPTIVLYNKYAEDKDARIT